MFPSRRQSARRRGPVRGGGAREVGSGEAEKLLVIRYRLLGGPGAGSYRVIRGGGEREKVIVIGYWEIDQASSIPRITNNQ